MGLLTTVQEWLQNANASLPEFMELEEAYLVMAHREPILAA